MRNLSIFAQIVGTIAPYVTDPAAAQHLLEEHFHDGLIVDAGSVDSVTSFAKQLRLDITREESVEVLDYMALKAIGVNIDHVETAVFEVFGNRFIEPGE